MGRKASKVFKQSGVIPYRVKNGKIEVLLITSRKRQHWVIPKGGISKAMTRAQTQALTQSGVSARKKHALAYHKKLNASQSQELVLQPCF